ncbi:hypothetical protein LCGC14_1608870 [marine sediment metagenome]|uniref:Uncharacterized protein n=1 Tax=marine sediment metagenome TaxID=412755 RepID=A0A0F9I8Y2_9ZZZZ
MATNWTEKDVSKVRERQNDSCYESIIRCKKCEHIQH